MAKDTVKLWALKNGYSTRARISSRRVYLEPQILNQLKLNKSRKEIQKSLNVHYQVVTEIALKHGLQNTLRARSVAALDKILTLEEATSRLPEGSVWPDFYYVIGGKLYTRTKAKTLGVDLNKAKKIYDCGKKRWIFTI